MDLINVLLKYTIVGFDYGWSSFFSGRDFVHQLGRRLDFVATHGDYVLRLAASQDKLESQPEVGPAFGQ